MQIMLRRVSCYSTTEYTLCLKNNTFVYQTNAYRFSIFDSYIIINVKKLISLGCKLRLRTTFII